MNKLNILVVDDEEMELEILKNYFEKEGHSVTTAKDGNIALDEFNKSNYDIIFLDYNMPGYNGSEVCKIIKKSKPAQKLIILTGNFTDEAYYSSIEDEICPECLIYKPIDLEQIKSCMEKVLKGIKIYQTNN
ncbi:MAG: response regulator [Candidatus Aureabacteria bacterium]|nr:response regulator [Candidatus Auribacterota bacterium]